MSTPNSDFEARICAQLDRLQTSVDDLRNRVEHLSKQSKCRGVLTPTATPDAVAPKRAPTSTLLTCEQMSELLGCAPRTLRRWELDGTIPKSIHIGGAKRWRGGDVDKWLEARRR